MKDIFEKLFKTIDPESKLITEEKKIELFNLFENKIKELKESVYSEAVEALDQKHGQELEEILEAKDYEYGNKLEKILEVEDEKNGEKLEEILEAKDYEYGKMLEEILEAKELEYGTKLEEILNKLDEDCTSKLKQVIDLYESKKINGEIVEKVSDYLDTYLEEVKPSKTIIDESKLYRLQKFYESVKELALINDDYIQTEIKEAVEDAKSQLDEKDAEINRLMVEKIELKNKFKKIEAEKMLSEKTKDMPLKKKLFIESFFKNASKEEIEGKFNEAVNAFEVDQKSTRTKIVENIATSTTKIEPIINEVEQIIPKSPMMEEYLSIMEKIDKKNRKV